jgi:hypothetical protein
MFLASTNDSFVLRDNGERPPRKTPFQGNPYQERIAYPAIRDQLFLVWGSEGWSVFDGPETMPTGTGDDRSGSSQPTTEDDPLIPSQAKRWLNEMI